MWKVRTPRISSRNVASVSARPSLRSDAGPEESHVAATGGSSPRVSSGPDESRTDAARTRSIASHFGPL